MTDFFINAADARSESKGRLDIMKEIQAIQSQIEVAIEASSLTAIVGPGTTPTPIVTTMTASSVYFNAWQNPQQFTDDASNVARAKMNEVIKYFVKLGYTTQRTQQGSGPQFNWTISW